ncbi:CD226 antigen isoform X2 [Nycticebus coucang]|uniref:CD226 antigen isoform X2 n=1 Tax=Nycticebus coucang TaxID=9470 RepID=UPI00234CCC50|nr:CD226 antigen isoform X2 [Nycticebus coucang]
MGYLAFLLAILHAYKALSEEIFWDTTVRLAENMTLECVYPSADTLTQMEWFKVTSVEKEAIAIFSPTHGVVIRTPYADRVSFVNSSMAPNDISLSFHNVSEADVGYYSCFLHTFPQGTWQKVIQVVQSDSFEIAEPLISHIVSEPGENVTLTCQLQMKWSVQQVTWEKIQPRQIDRLTCCNFLQGRNYTSKYRRQVSTTCTQGSRRSFIIIPNVTASDSGLYRCCFQASTGENDTLVMRLTITAGRTSSRYIPFLAGGMALLLLLVILITTTVTVISCNRRRERHKRDLFAESWDTQIKAPSNCRSPISASLPTDDAREDVYVNYPTFSHRPKTRV